MDELALVFLQGSKRSLGPPCDVTLLPKIQILIRPYFLNPKYKTFSFFWCLD